MILYKYNILPQGSKMQQDKENSKKVQPYLPIYHRQPNKFSHYEKEDFTDKAGNKAVLRIAHYFDKSGKPMTMVAQVIWIE
jgi:hypothetical protein